MFYDEIYRNVLVVEVSGVPPKRELELRTPKMLRGDSFTIKEEEIKDIRQPWGHDFSVCWTYQAPGANSFFLI